MSDRDPRPETGGPAPPGEGAPSEEELRQLEEQLRQVRVEDVLAQSVASVVNLTARRIVKEDERDLDQARLGIEAIKALVDLMPEQVAPNVKQALSELQVLYARTANGQEPLPDSGQGSAEGAGPARPGASGEAAPPGPDPGPGPAGGPGGPGKEPPPRLWTPPGSS